MKKIYEFTLEKTVNSEELVIEKNEKGEEIKVLKPITRKVPQKFFLAKPGRVLREKAEIYYNKIFWECQKEGILPLTQLHKRFSDDGGILTQEEDKWRKDAYETVWNKQAEYKALTEKQELNTEETEKAKKLLDEIVDVWADIQTFEESKGGTLYQNTAEAVAKNRQTLWWMVNLIYSEDDKGNTKLVFGDGSLEDKLNVFDNFNEGEDLFNNNLAQRAFTATSLWNFGRAETQIDFDVAMKAAEAKGLLAVASAIYEQEKTTNKPTVETTNNKDSTPTT